MEQSKPPGWAERIRAARERRAALHRSDGVDTEQQAAELGTITSAQQDTINALRAAVAKREKDLTPPTDS